MIKKKKKTKSERHEGKEKKLKNTRMREPAKEKKGNEEKTEVK